VPAEPACAAAPLEALLATPWPALDVEAPVPPGAVLDTVVGCVVAVGLVAATGVADDPDDPPPVPVAVEEVVPSAQMAEKPGAVAGAGAEGLAGPGSWNRQPSTSPGATTCSAGPSLA
jgi:hypothetical protein